MAVELKNEQIYVYESYEKKYNFEDSLKKKPFSITSFINYLTDITSGEDEKIKRGIEKIICVQDDEICQDIKTLFLQPNTVFFRDITYCFNSYCCIF